jgi:hypothetical protein
MKEWFYYKEAYEKPNKPMAQTAVEWLYNHLFPKQLDGFSEEERDKIDKAFEKAKQMEREQIEKAALALSPYRFSSEAEQYYNKTYCK